MNPVIDQLTKAVTEHLEESLGARGITVMARDPSVHESLEMIHKIAGACVTIVPGRIVSIDASDAEETPPEVLFQCVVSQNTLFKKEVTLGELAEGVSKALHEWQPSGFCRLVTLDPKLPWLKDKLLAGVCERVLNFRIAVPEIFRREAV